MDIKYTVHDDFDKVFDEKGNTFLALRKISWGEKSEPKLDIRKWYIDKNGNETVGKGFSFLTEDGPSELTHALLESGFGETKTIIDKIKDREDFKSSLLKSIGKEELQNMDIEITDEQSDDDLYDPKVIFD